MTKVSVVAKAHPEALSMLLERDDDCWRIRLQFGESTADESMTRCGSANNTFGSLCKMFFFDSAPVEAVPQRSSGEIVCSATAVKMAGFDISSFATKAL